MKCLQILLLLSISTATLLAIQPANVPAIAIATAPAATLTQELDDLLHIIPRKQLSKLVWRYLLNDEEFQAIIRSINSQDAFIVRMRFRSQPEVINFTSWMRTQFMLSSDSSMEWMDSMELSNIFNPTPMWKNPVYGWQGFVNEFQSYYPEEWVREQIRLKVQSNGVFAQFWNRLKAVQPAFDRMLTYPETQRILNQLQTRGVNTDQLIQFVCTQFGWLASGTSVANQVGAISTV